MEILDAGIRHQSPEDESAISLLQYDASLLRKDLGKARLALFLLIITNVAGMIIGFSKHEAQDVWLEGLILVGVYAGCAWYMSRNAKTALIIGASMYALQVIVYALLMPETLAKGIILKAIIVFYFVKGLIAASKLEKIRESLREYGEELSLTM